MQGNGFPAGDPLRSAPEAWTKCGDIYSDEKSRSVFVCSACLDRVDSFELGFQTADASSFWAHVQMLHAGPAARHLKRKQPTGPPAHSDERQKPATRAEQQTKKIKAENVVVIEIDDAADRDSEGYSDNETDAGSELNTFHKKQTEVGAAKSEEVPHNIIMDCKVESEVLATQAVPSLQCESPVVVINLDDEDDDEDTVMFAEPSTQPPLKLERSQNDVIAAKHSDNDYPENNKSNEPEANRVSKKRQEEKKPDLSVKQELFEQDLPTAAEDCEKKLQMIFGELREDADVDEAALNASSDGNELQDEDLFCFYKECSVADYQIGDLIELSDNDDDDCDRNIYSPSLFSKTNSWANKQDYACTCPKCLETFGDSADFKEHLKIHMQEDLKQREELPPPQQQSASPTQRMDEVQQQRWHQPATATPKQQEQQQQQQNIETQPSAPEHDQATTLTCSHCQRSFCHAWQHERHMRIHTKAPQQHKKTQKQSEPTSVRNKTRPFQCKKCGKRTSTEDAMQLHIQRFHSGSTNADTAKCHECGKVLLKHSLQQHLLLHSTECCYKCQLCNYASKQKQSLNTHLKKQHAEAVASRQRQNHRTGENAAGAPPSPAAVAPEPAAVPMAPNTPSAKPQLTAVEQRQMYELYLIIHERMQQNAFNHRTSNAIPDAANFGPPRFPPLPPHAFSTVAPGYAAYPPQSQFALQRALLPANEYI